MSELLLINLWDEVISIVEKFLLSLKPSGPTTIKYLYGSDGGTYVEHLFSALYRVEGEGWYVLGLKLTPRVMDREEDCAYFDTEFYGPEKVSGDDKVLKEITTQSYIESSKDNDSILEVGVLSRLDKVVSTFQLHRHQPDVEEEGESQRIIQQQSSADSNLH